MTEFTSDEFLSTHKEIVTNSDVIFENIIPDIATSLSERALKFICNFSGKDKKIFEFGTWIGRSSLVFSQNFKDVYTIDYIEGSDIGYNYAGYSSGYFIKDKINVKYFNEDSTKFNYDNLSTKFDVILVDGNHSYEGATSDLKNALNIVNHSSMIFVDDYTNPYFGVNRAVNEVDNKYKKYYISDVNLVILIVE